MNPAAHPLNLDSLIRIPHKTAHKDGTQAWDTSNPPSRVFALAGIPFSCSSLPRKKTPKNQNPS